MPRLILYRPLAVLMAVLLLPALTWLDSGALESGTGPHSVSGGSVFRASAETIGGCHPAQPNSIIQIVCPDNLLYAPDLYQLESDAVAAYLGEHNLPASDAHFIYDEGRPDLRTEIRATIFAGLLGIINKPASQRTQHEQNLYAWLQYLVQKNEIAEYTLAIQQYQAWRNNPCGFKLDPYIASQYNLSYNGAPYCGTTLINVLQGTLAPDKGYFTGCGETYAYGKPSQTYPDFATLVMGTGANVGEVWGIGVGAGALLAASASGAILYGSTSLFPYAFGENAPEFTDFGEMLAEVLGATDLATTAAGVAGVVLLAVIIGVEEGITVFNNEKTIQDLNNLTNNLADATNNKPDLGAFAADTSGDGLYKLLETFVAQTLPGLPGTAALPAHRPGTDPGFAIAPSGGDGVASEVLNYQDWYGIQWSAQTYGGWFVQTCQSGANCLRADSMNADIQYVDWSGTKWTASRIGYSFVNTKLAPAATDHPCPADEATGVSPGSDFSACISYVSSSIPLKDATGNPVKVSLTLKPAFSSSATLNFTTGRNETGSITATGNPAPAISLVSGNLPAGLIFQPGTGTASLNYTNAPKGTYQATVMASNGYGSATQTLTINVVTQLSITSPAVLTGMAGVPVNFLVTTTGDLPITLSIDPALLPFTGLSFKDNGNGTATISGIGVDSGASCINFDSSAPCGITATNATGSVTQGFSVNLTAAPSASLVGPPNATFSAGNPNSLLVESSGAITPVYWIFNEFGRAPSWLSFHDNGDGTGQLTGTPPAGTSGSFTFTLFPYAAGTLFSPSDFTLNVADIPGFLTPDVATFTAGTEGSFEIRTDGPAADLGNVTLPEGLSFQSGNPATITGTPAAGTGGKYTFLLSATDSRGTGSQILTVAINEQPKITSADVAYFNAGVPSSFEVTTVGYPNLSTRPNPAIDPTSPDQGAGMHFDVSGLPPSFTATNLNPYGFATGTLTITGTPTTADLGAHQITVTANNGVGTAVTQTFYLSVLQTAAAPSSSDTCDGVYSGTFNGDVRVHPGQSCTFAGGTITGNLYQLGGTLTLQKATVGGYVEIENNQYGDGFDIEDSTFNSSIIISNITPGPAKDRVCGSKITGSLDANVNSAAIQVGGPSPCSANTFGGALNIGFSSGPVTAGDNTITGNANLTSNTGTVQFFDNAIGGILQCTGNTSITGYNDTAAQKTGQCAAF